MGAIKKKNNRNDLYSALEVVNRRSTTEQSSYAVATDMGGPIQRIRMATTAAVEQLESSKAPADILASLQKLDDECEICRAILFRAFTEL
ncbi:hypothetical protein GCM10022278_29310 [Allohahella marinimesophila]|uniref:Uncharacterized protein n=1 Tax=Allohahella marinimesophila TaxID=1054972 RepID=A0ABP7PR62_9GAMM